MPSSSRESAGRSRSERFSTATVSESRSKTSAGEFRNTREICFGPLRNVAAPIARASAWVSRSPGKLPRTRRCHVGHTPPAPPPVTLIFGSTYMASDQPPTEQRAQHTEVVRVIAEQGRQDAEHGRGFTEEQRLAAESARDEAEQFRRLAEEAREVRDQHRQALESVRQEREQLREAGETARVAGEEARVAAEAARHATLEAVHATAETLQATLESMKAIEE